MAEFQPLFTERQVADARYHFMDNILDRSTFELSPTFWATINKLSDRAIALALDAMASEEDWDIRELTEGGDRTGSDIAGNPMAPEALWNTPANRAAADGRDPYTDWLTQSTSAEELQDPRYADWMNDTLNGMGIDDPFDFS